MKAYLQAIVAVVFCCGIGLLVTGCEDNGDNAPVVDVSGKWIFNNYAGKRTTGALTQSPDGVLSGNIGTGQVSGNIRKYFVQLTVVHPDRLIYIRADVSQDGLTMEGSWRMTNAQGSFSAVRR